MFNLMETWGYRPKHSNPCDGIKKYKENARIRYLSKKELKLFFKEIIPGYITCQNISPINLLKL